MLLAFTTPTSPAVFCQVPLQTSRAPPPRLYYIAALAQPNRRILLRFLHKVLLVVFPIVLTAMILAIKWDFMITILIVTGEGDVSVAMHRLVMAHQIKWSFERLRPAFRHVAFMHEAPILTIWY